MHIIKLNAIDSTNSYLRNLSMLGAINDFTVVITNNQTEGRGQMGSVWKSESGKNLTVSIFKKFPELKSHQNFKISMLVSMAILDTLKHFNLRRLKIKWPNDILSDNYKLGGILIENVIKNQKNVGTIIGIGLNVNQTDFEGIPRASSLKLLQGKTFDLDEVLQQLLHQLKHSFLQIGKMNFNSVKAEYEKHLFRKSKPSTFSDTNGKLFSGYINGVSDYGKLQLILEDEKIKEYDLKEIQMMY